MKNWRVQPLGINSNFSKNNLVDTHFYLWECVFGSSNSPAKGHNKKHLREEKRSARIRKVSYDEDSIRSCTVSVTSIGYCVTAKKTGHGYRGSV